MTNKNLLLEVKLNTLKQNLQTQKLELKRAKKEYLTAKEVYENCINDCSEIENEIATLETLLNN